MTKVEQFAAALASAAPDYQIILTPDIAQRLATYYSHLDKWNSRFHLVAPCDPAEFATRHVLESLMIEKHLPPAARAIDIGSGAGLPIIPALVARKDLKATLIESDSRKSVFLKEALKRTGCADQATVIKARFQEIPAPTGDFVTCRALERFRDVLPQILGWIPRPATLLFFGGEELGKILAELRIRAAPELIPNSAARYLFTARTE